MPLSLVPYQIYVLIMIVIPFTADTLGFKTYPPAYLSPKASGKNLLIGANFASAGSGYDDKTAILSVRKFPHSLVWLPRKQNFQSSNIVPIHFQHTEFSYQYCDRKIITHIVSSFSAFFYFKSCCSMQFHCLNNQSTTRSTKLSQQRQQVVKKRPPLSRMHYMQWELVAAILFRITMSILSLTKYTLLISMPQSSLAYFRASSRYFSVLNQSVGVHIYFTLALVLLGWC